MRYLSACFIGEGSTDRALAPIYERTTEEILSKFGESVVEIGTPEIGRPRDRTLATVIEEASKLLEFHDVFLLHTDGKGDPHRAREERIEPVFEKLRSEWSSKRRAFVGVVPVHEIEAWLLADGDALRKTLGTKRPLAELGVPTEPGDIEALDDPKTTLREAQRKALGGRRAGRSKLKLPYELLAENIQLQALRRLSAFQRFEQDLCDALAALGLAAPR